MSYTDDLDWENLSYGSDYSEEKTNQSIKQISQIKKSSPEISNNFKNSLKKSAEEPKINNQNNTKDLNNFDEEKKEFIIKYSNNK